MDNSGHFAHGKIILVQVDTHLNTFEGFFDRRFGILKEANAEIFAAWSKNLVIRMEVQTCYLLHKYKSSPCQNARSTSAETYENNLLNKEHTE